MANMRDVASLAGVGVGTVSRVINASPNVSDEVKKRVEDAISQLHYVPNHSAQSLKTHKTGIIGLFIPVLANPFFCVFAEKAEELLDKRGYKTLVVCSQSDKNKELKFLVLLAQNHVDGAILLTHNDLGKTDKNLPIVTIDRHIENVPCITSDNYDSTVKAVKFLMESGCKKIAYLGGKPSISSEVENRFKAYTDTVKKYGMQNMSLYEIVRHGEEDAFAERLFDYYGTEIDAVFCSTDILGVSVYKAAQKRGIKVPEQLKIVTYDGVLNYLNVYPDLTCVMQDIDGMAEHAVNELMNRIEKRDYNDKVVVPTKFHFGETS